MDNNQKVFPSDSVATNYFTKAASAGGLIY